MANKHPKPLPITPGRAQPGAGRKASWFRDACREITARIDIPSFWAKVVNDESMRITDRMEASRMLIEFGHGKALQPNANINADLQGLPEPEVIENSIARIERILGSAEGSSEVETIQ